MLRKITELYKKKLKTKYKIIVTKINRNNVYSFFLVLFAYTVTLRSIIKHKKNLALELGDY